MEAKGKGGVGGKRKKVHNLLAAFLIELPQHFSRGRSARRLDGLIRMHVRTHTHKQTKGRQSYAEKGSASDELSSVVFLRQIRLSCAQAKQKRWWPPLKSFKKASPRAVLLVHKDASQWNFSRCRRDVYFICLTGLLCISNGKPFCTQQPNIKGPWGTDWLQKGYIIHSHAWHSSYLPPPSHCGSVQELVKYENHQREHKRGSKRDLKLLRKQINLGIVVINPVSTRKAPASSREANRRFPSQLCISMWTTPTHTHAHRPSD